MKYRISHPTKIVSGLVSLPASKSISNRVLIIKKLCKGGSQSKKKVKLRLDEPKVIYPNTRLVKKVFNWKPNTKFEIGLKKTINFYKNA